MKYERDGLPPWTWAAHGVDVAASLIFSRHGSPGGGSPEEALAFLMRELAASAKDIGADLLVIAIPSHIPQPEPFNILANGPWRFVDLSPAMNGRPDLFIPIDGHPSVAGHAVIAAEIGKLLRERPGSLRLR
jgi:hypothetical protein